MQSLTGKLSISGRIQGGGLEDKVRITLTDESSHTQAVDITLSKSDFANVLFGLFQVPCDYEFNDQCPMGKVREHKTVIVAIPDHSYHNREDVAAAAIKPHEVDGWIGSLKDAMNHHNRLRSSNEYRVSFVRFADGEGKPCE